jgi:TonB family protein
MPAYNSCVWHRSNAKLQSTQQNMRLFALFAVAIGFNMGAPAQQTAKASAVLVELSQPVYPPLARQANIYGDVSVAVTVHPDGNTEVAFERGHPMLRQAALDSAQKSRFECRDGDATVTYQLVYSFRLAKGSDCCSALSVPARVTLEPHSSDPNIQEQARRITITADEICICDPPAQLTKKSRSLKCLYLWKCSD